MAPKTTIDPATFDRVIGQHEDVHVYITTERSRIADEVAGVTSTGNMVESLVTVHGGWDTDMGDILKSLERMIGLLKHAKEVLVGQDEGATVSG